MINVIIIIIHTIIIVISVVIIIIVIVIVIIIIIIVVVIIIITIIIIIIIVIIIFNNKKKTSRALGQILLFLLLMPVVFLQLPSGVSKSTLTIDPLRSLYLSFLTRCCVKLKHSSSNALDCPPAQECITWLEEYFTKHMAHIQIPPLCSSIRKDGKQLFHFTCSYCITC